MTIDQMLYSEFRSAREHLFRTEELSIKSVMHVMRLWLWSTYELEDEEVGKNTRRVMSRELMGDPRFDPRAWHEATAVVSELRDSAHARKATWLLEVKEGETAPFGSYRVLGRILRELDRNDADPGVPIDMSALRSASSANRMGPLWNNGFAFIELLDDMLPEPDEPEKQYDPNISIACLLFDTTYAELQERWEALRVTLLNPVEPGPTLQFRGFENIGIAVSNSTSAIARLRLTPPEDSSSG